MADKKRLSIIIGAIEKVSGPIGRINQAINTVRAPVDRVNRSLNKLGRQAGLKEFNRGLRKSAKHARAAANSLTKVAQVGAGLGLAGVALTKSYANAGDNIAKTSLRLGIGVEALQEYRFAADRSGVSTQTFDMSLQRLVRKSSETARGVGEARGAFKALGIDVKDSNGQLKDAETILTETLSSLGRVRSDSTRNDIAAKLFDSEGVAMVQLAAAGADGIKGMRQEAHKLGLVITKEQAESTEEFTDKLTNLGAVLAGIKNTIGASLLPVLSKLTDRFSVAARDNLPAVNKEAKTLASVLEKIGNFVFALSERFGVMNTILTVAATVIGFQVVSAIASLAVAFKVLGLSIALTPFGLILAGLAGVITIVALFYKNWGMVKKYAVSAILAVVTAVAGLQVALLAIGSTMALNPLGLLVVGIAGVVAGTIAIYKNWDKVKAGFSAFGKFVLNNNPFALIAKSVNWVIKSLTGFDVLGAIGAKLQNLLPQWAMDLLDLESSTKLVSAPIPNSRAQVGGTVHVKIDSEGRPRVQDIRSDNTDIPIMVDAGMAMAGP